VASCRDLWSPIPETPAGISRYPDAAAGGFRQCKSRTKPRLRGQIRPILKYSEDLGGRPRMGQRRWFDVVVTLVFVAVATLEAQAPHSNGGARSPGKSSLFWLAPYREAAARLIGEAVGSTFAWQRLAVLTDSVGSRLSGSPALDRAIQWSLDEMKRDGLENVHAERVLVPKWVRGAESAEIVEPAPHALVMLGLGDSIGTPPEGIQADVLTIH